jgi:hypothetical protein
MPRRHTTAYPPPGPTPTANSSSPVRALVATSNSSIAAIPDQDPGSGPLSLFLHKRHALSLVRAPQEGGRVPAQQQDQVLSTIQHMLAAALSRHAAGGADKRHVVPEASMTRPAHNQHTVAHYDTHSVHSRSPP